MTKPEIENKIAELEQWLIDNPNENESRSYIQSDLRKAKEDLKQFDDHRTIERDTFDIREHNFNDL